MLVSTAPSVGPKPFPAVTVTLKAGAKQCLKQSRKGALSESAFCLHLCHGPAGCRPVIGWLSGAGQTLEWKEPQVAERVEGTVPSQQNQEALAAHVVLAMLWPPARASAKPSEALRALLCTQNTFSLPLFHVSHDLEIAFPLFAELFL